MRVGFVRWIMVALIGLVFAVGIGIAASTLASERIGLTSEPFTTGDSLAPEAVTHPAPRGRRPEGKVQTRPAPREKPSAPVPQSEPPVSNTQATSPDVGDDSGHIEVDREHESEPDGDGDD